MYVRHGLFLSVVLAACDGPSPTAGSDVTTSADASLGDADVAETSSTDEVAVEPGAITLAVHRAAVADVAGPMRGVNTWGVRANDGEMLVVVGLQLTNPADGEPLAMRPDNFRIGADGLTFMPMPAPDDEASSPCLGAFEVGPGASYTCEIVFALPDDAQPSTVEYHADDGRDANAALAPEICFCPPPTDELGAFECHATYGCVVARSVQNIGPCDVWCDAHDLDCVAALVASGGWLPTMSPIRCDEHVFDYGACACAVR